MNPSIKRIIVPTDFSEIANDVLDGAIFIANSVGAEIVLLHVFETVSFNSALEKVLSLGKHREKLIDAAVDDSFASVIENTKRSHPKLVFKTMKASGKIYEEIAKAAKSTKADLIIMGTHGVSGVDKYLMGTNAERVVKSSECPVITFTKNPENPGLDNILLPLDLTNETKEKVVKAIELGQIFKAKIKVLSILKTDDEFIVNKLQRQIKQVESFIKSSNVECSSEIISGSNIADDIIQYADKNKFDLIVVMSQNENNSMVDYILGSNAQRIIHNSTIPVLSIRPMKRKDTTSFTPY